jgi:nucleoside transporter
MFLQFFIWGTWYATMGTYLFEINFDGADVGNIFSTVSLAAIVSPLFVGIIADRFFAAEKVLGALHIIGAGVLYWVSTITDPSSFYWILLLYSICYMPTLAIVNAVAFYQMEDPGKEFPTIRVLGTIGWIAAGLLIGNMQLESSHLQFVIGAGVSVLMGIYCFFLPNTPPKAKGQKADIAKLLGLDALKLMKRRNFAVLVISSLLVSIPLSFYYAFANPFFNEEGMVNAASKMTLGQGSEILFLLLMPLIFRRLGTKKMILIGILAWVLRYILFAYGDNQTFVWMFYLGIILHGICYDFFFVTGQIYVDEAAPEELRSSAQGLITLATYGIGMYIGSIVAGQVVNAYTIMENGEAAGHHWWDIWIVPAVLAFVVLLIFAVLFREEKKLA